MDVHFLPNNYCISPVFDVLLNPFQDGWLGVEIVHGNVKEALVKTTIKSRLSYLLNQGCGSGSGLDPDADWIRIQSGQWIRIRNPDPDPGVQK